MSNVASLAERLWDIERDLFACSVEFTNRHPAGISANDVFSVHSDVDKSSGRFICRIQTKPNIQHLDDALSSFLTQVLLRVRSSTSEEPEILSIDFLPALVLHTNLIHLNQVQVRISWQI